MSAAMWDTRSEVKNAATDATLRALNTCQNSDIRPFIPAVIEAIKHPEEVPEVHDIYIHTHTHTHIYILYIYRYPKLRHTHAHTHTHTHTDNSYLFVTHVPNIYL